MTWDDELERRKALAEKRWSEQVTRANAEYVAAVREVFADFAEGLLTDPDDELGRLVSLLLERFGKDGFRDAMNRAITYTLTRKDDDGRIPSGVLEEAVRTELLRLARPQ